MTHGYVTRRSLRGMEWTDLREPHDRLRWARVRWQDSRGISPDAGAAAESMGLNKHTYRAYERRPDASKHIPLDHQRAIQFGRKFGVSWTWLLLGEGTPEETDVPMTPNERRVIDALRGAPEDRQAAAADAIIQLLRIA